ncbi:MAG: hypothetical protein NTU97_02945 [Candidatus Magasanikbacteria bacterium]|nr:hypothetical protein [Candidatus Magasanikbacteria bacterium]
MSGERSFVTPEEAPPVGTEAYKELKREINAGKHEGVFIGTQEEVDNAMKKIEGEGRAEDLASFIRLHKEVIMNMEDMKQVEEDSVSFFKGLSEKMEAMPTGAAYYDSLADVLYFKDSIGNLAKVSVDLGKIADLRKYKDSPFQKQQAVEAELEKNGFTLDKTNGPRSFILFRVDLIALETDLNKIRGKRLKTESKTTFNF